jgi:flagellar L-ring protein precursor FlgH
MQKSFALVVTTLLLQACSGMASMSQYADDADYASPPPSAAYAQPVAAPGTIYNAGGAFDLFMDRRARSVGDILTVMLVERTDASKESSTSTAKGSSVDTGLPIFAGRPITSGGTPILNSEFGSDSSFDGSADSSQSNRLDGSITVTVAERLPNGNLLVSGEKRITINQGEEFVRLQGIVRPVDIGPANSVPSTKVGDARITYSGRGTLADSNRPGWLSRFFNSPWVPF